MREMILVKFRTIVFKGCSPPVLILALALLHWYLDVLKARSTSTGIIFVLHICILMHDKFSIGVVIIVVTLVIHVNEQIEVLGSVFIKLNSW